MSIVSLSWSSNVSYSFVWKDRIYHRSFIAPILADRRASCLVPHFVPVVSSAMIVNWYPLLRVIARGLRTRNPAKQDHSRKGIPTRLLAPCSLYLLFVPASSSGLYAQADTKTCLAQIKKVLSFKVSHLDASARSESVTHGTTKQVTNRQHSLCLYAQKQRKALEASIYDKQY